jgi:hypothetical protein
MISVSPSSRHSQWVVSYTQSDVDTIRQQIEETESNKRRWLIVALIVTVAALAGVFALLTTSYALYSKSESEKKRFSEENAALKSNVEKYQQQLAAATAALEKESQTRAESQSSLEKLMPAVLNANATESETARFAQMVSNLPGGRLEIAEKPPDKLFRNWRLKTDSATEIYTLVGGFVDGKWTIHSNLVARR